MKSIAPLGGRARRACGAVAAALLITACGGSAPAPQSQPVAGDVERAQFDPSLGIHLAAMSRRSDGMYVQDLTMGTGAVAARGRTVVVRYTGWLPNGQQIDSGEITVTLGSNKTIRAWEEGLLGMRVGGKRRLVAPALLAYGDKANGTIPANSVLIFDMEMESVI